MKKAVLIALILGNALLACGQQPDDSLSLDDLVQSAQDWAKENLDKNALRVLQSADQEKVKQFLDEIQRQFQGQYVFDLAKLRNTAKTILPLLESHEETRPYAEWLKTRLDYLDAANELRLTIPPPKPEPGQPPPPLPNPQPQQERDIWVKKLAHRPWPEAAKPYIAKLKPIFAEQNVPPQLVWIAEVESSFDPTARSPAGAVGLFQLMPATAQQYGLRTWPFDQRLNSEKSAHAAAKYLAYLYGCFKNWRLALAAYNAGEGTVQKLLDRCKAKTYDQIASYLPAETQMYVPRVEATLQRREGVKLSELPGAWQAEGSLSLNQADNN